MSRVFLFLLPMFFYYSCGLETASPDYNSDLIIASNFLHPKDSVHYKNFEKKTKIHIKIIHLSADNIQNQLNNAGYNSKIDLIFVKSIKDLKSINDKNLHAFSYNYLKSELSSYKPVQNNRWLIAGIDPYIFSYFEQDSIIRPEEYSDLTDGFLWATPNEENIDVFLAYTKYHLRKNEKGAFRKWKQNLKRNQVIFDKGTDSLASQQFLLSKESDILSDKRLSKQKKRVIFIPKGIKGKYYSDKYSVALVEQASNFHNAKRLLKYINRLGRIPAPYHIKPYPKDDKKDNISRLSNESILSNLDKFN
jgi:ABC-type Fe3+ transport system substrate-binding protein